MKIRNSIVNQISFWFVFSTSALALSSIFVFYLSLKETLYKEHRNVVTDRMQTLRSVLERKQDPLPAAKRRIESEWANISFERIFIRLRTPQGEVVSISPNTPPEVLDQIFPNGESSHPASTRARKVSRSGNVYLIASEPFNLGEGQSQLYADLAFDVTGEEGVLGQLRWRLLSIIAVVLIASLVFGRKLALASLRPVQGIAERANEIGSSNLHERIDTAHLPFELELLVDTFNRMLDRLSDSFTRMSQFSSDLAHELRTPVNNIRGELEVTIAKPRSLEEYREVLSSCLEELERISKITDSLLFIAKAENPSTQLVREICDVEKELRKIAEFYESSALEREMKIKVQVDGALELAVDRTLFQRAVGNLISNALAHTDARGGITLKGFQDSQFIYIEVSDTGHGIAPEHLTKIFDRFYRADPARSGAGPTGFGLGLAIVQGIIKLHSGEIEVQSKIGVGTQITLKFPRASRLSS